MILIFHNERQEAMNGSEKEMTVDQRMRKISRFTTRSSMHKPCSVSAIKRGEDLRCVLYDEAAHMNP